MVSLREFVDHFLPGNGFESGRFLAKNQFSGSEYRVVYGFLFAFLFPIIMTVVSLGGGQLRVVMLVYFVLLVLVLTVLNFEFAGPALFNVNRTVGVIGGESERDAERSLFISVMAGLLIGGVLGGISMFGSFQGSVLFQAVGAGLVSELGLVWGVVIVGVVVAVVEELLYGNAAYFSSVEDAGILVGLVWSAGLFMVHHFFLFETVAGTLLVLGLYRVVVNVVHVLTESMLAGIISHVLFNTLSIVGLYLTGKIPFIGESISVAATWSIVALLVFPVLFLIVPNAIQLGRERF